MSCWTPLCSRQKVKSSREYQRSREKEHSGDVAWLEPTIAASASLRYDNYWQLANNTNVHGYFPIFCTSTRRWHPMTLGLRHPTRQWDSKAQKYHASKHIKTYLIHSNAPCSFNWCKLFSSHSSGQTIWIIFDNSCHSSLYWTANPSLFTIFSYPGWWLGHPSEKYERHLGWLFPRYGKIKNVPNHQPDLFISFTSFYRSTSKTWGCFPRLQRWPGTSLWRNGPSSRSRR